MNMDLQKELRSIVRSNPMLMSILAALRSAQLPDAWVTGGVIRNLVWNRLHGRMAPFRVADIDIIYFDPHHISKIYDQEYERQISDLRPGLRFSVKNQARMHVRNADSPYQSVSDALSKVPDSASSVAVSLARDGQICILAPHNLDDLFALRLRPTPYGREHPLRFIDRVRKKRWLELWPNLTMEPS